MLKRRRSKNKVKLILGIITTTIITLILIDIQIRPLVKSLAASQAQIISTKAISEAIEHELARIDIDYSDLVTIQKGEDGSICAISTNVQKTNTLKSAVTLAIEEQISHTTPKTVSIPLGTLSGLELFTGRGPMIKMKISLPGSTITDFRSEFTEAGINQTKHQIYINVHTNVHALIPGYPTNTTVDTDIMVAETIIVGDVPHVFASSSSNNHGTIADLAQLDN